MADVALMPKTGVWLVCWKVHEQAKHAWCFETA